jgi:hypothetical protein
VDNQGRARLSPGSLELPRLVPGILGGLGRRQHRPVRPARHQPPRADLQAVHERRRARAASPRNLAQRRALRAALIPIAGKYIARRSPATPQLITLAGGPETPEGTWPDHLATLRRLLDEHTAAGTGPPESITATHAYLDIVAATLA